MTPTLTRHASADAFLDVAQQWLMRAEVENNVILGIVAGFANVESPPNETPYFVTAHAGGAVVGCAVRSPPYPLAIARCADSAALELIVRDVIAAYPDLQQVGGPEPTITQFAALWGASKGRTARRRNSMRMYEIRRPPASVHNAPGSIRVIEERDLDLVTSWLAKFVAVLGLSDPDDPAQIARRRLGEQSLYVWEDGSPVSMAGFGGKTPNGIRVNLVFTPEAARRRGYASACVATLTRMLLEGGHRYCALYADRENPTANAIYQRVGYERVCEAADYRLDV
jgi:predicted GNAT family acetyltransferase